MKMPKKKSPEYELFEEAMDAFSKLAKVALEALRPYKDHVGSCSTACPSCRLKACYFKIKSMTTEIPKP